ncbi:MAG TPA: molybdopterin dinucleotide binding domain-containing protein [Polyangiaceae bacterium]|nr:molybdopterin dinucleotide binding domain-containing protein [Polyangiaceae bacterium]
MTTSRRGFLGGAAAALGAGALAGCADRLPRYLVPAAVPADDATPGIARFYRTICRGCQSACGVTARVREGRVISLEGNPEHPLSRGGLCPQGQAAIEDLYAPERLGAPRGTAGEISWEAAERALAEGLRKARDDKKLIVILSRPERGSTGNLMRAWLTALGQQPSQVVTFDALASPWLAEGARRAFGADAKPVYDMASAKLLLSIGDDFVEEGSPVEHARALADQRAAGGRFVYVGPRLSLTAAAADEWLSVTPGTEDVLVLGLARAVMDASAPPLPSDVLSALRARLAPYDLPAVAARTGLGVGSLRDLAAELASGRPSLCVGPGRAVAGDNAATLAEAVFVLNAVAGNLGSTLKLAPRSQEAWAAPSMDVAELVKRASAGEVGALVVHHANPVGFGAAFGELATALGRVPFVASFTNYLDGTAKRSHLVLPDHHFLEAWSSDDTRAGVTGIQQPAMTPLLETRSAADVLLAAARALEATTGLPAGEFGESVRAAFDEKLVEHGGRFVELPPESASLAGDVLATLAPLALQGPADGLPLVVAPSLRHPNGLLPQGELLREIPDALTRVAWSGWVELHPATAAKLGVQHGERVVLDAAPGRTELPAFVTPAIREGVVAVPIGYAVPLFDGRAPALGFATRVRVQPTGQPAELFPKKEDRTQHGRPLARSVSTKNPRLPLLPPNPSMYPPVEHPEHRWALAIDLDRCNGCGACVAACYVENNNAIVGALESWRGRDMSWLRVHAFVETVDGAPQASFVPVGCQHCTNAPCEEVCPAYATYHTREGLNAMVYARCVGTRYCENNCPYSARAFNFFDHPRNERAALRLNPDVTVRERGITEKCTFCVQRIRAGEEQAKFEKRAVRDGEIVPACVSTCPARAMVFGDLKDPSSEISRWAADGRAYHLLEELNTQPGVVYLARRRDKAGT